MPIHTVFLDAGGVLVNPNWSRVSDALARHGVAVSAAALTSAEPRAKKRFDTRVTLTPADRDEDRWGSFFGQVFAEAGVHPGDAARAALADLQVYHQTLNLWETVPAEVRPALAALRAAGFRLVVVSNANGTLHRKFERLGLTDAFDLIFDSFDEGVEKPDPRLFQIALERSGSAASATVHVGDLYNIDVVGARAAGITPVLMDVAGLYPECDCLRIRSLIELPGVIA